MGEEGFPGKAVCLNACEISIYILLDRDPFSGLYPDASCEDSHCATTRVLLQEHSSAAREAPVRHISPRRPKHLGPSTQPVGRPPAVVYTGFALYIRWGLLYLCPFVQVLGKAWPCCNPQPCAGGGVISADPLRRQTPLSLQRALSAGQGRLSLGAGQAISTVMLHFPRRRPREVTLCNAIHAPLRLHLVWGSGTRGTPPTSQLADLKTWRSWRKSGEAEDPDNVSSAQSYE